MVSRSFAWLATNGGAWNLASNWNDLTDRIDPSLVVPGPQDSVTVSGPTGSGVQTLTGLGAVLSAAFLGNSLLAGSFAIGTVSTGADGTGGLLDIGAGGTLSAGAVNAASGSVLAAGTAASLAVSGTLTLGAGQSGLGAASANLYATNGAAITTGALLLNASTADLYVDPASSFEIGTLGGAIAGAVTIDPGATLGGQGDANGYGTLVNNGTILAQGGALLLGALSGSGQVDIEAGAEAVLNGTTQAGQTIDFAGANATLAFATEFDAPRGSIAAFAPGDALDVLGSPISAATWQQTSAGAGTLTLWYGGQTADTLLLSGSYTNDVFLTAGDGALGTLITVAPNGGGGGTASPGTQNPDQYEWIAPGGGNWNSAANWMDLTTGAQPAAIAPGQHDLVTMNAAQTGDFAVIAGPADAAALTLTGDIALAGTYALGTLTIGQAGNAALPGMLDLLPAGRIAAGSTVIADGGLTVSGSAALAVAGTLSLGGGATGVGLPITALSATAGGTVTAASIIMGGGSGDSLTTDPTGVIEVGTLGGAAAGAVTIDTGATLSGNGTLNPFGSIIDNGTIAAAGGDLWLAGPTGTGLLSIGNNAALVLQSGTALAIDLAGTSTVLAVASELVPLTGTITGFAQGDAIDIEGDPITAITTAKTTSDTSLSLYYGSTLVCGFTLAGTYANQRFVLAPDGGQGTAILVAPGSSSGGGGGQGNTDLLAWTQPGSGPWNRASNWTDVTTGSPATAPPGTENAVQIAGPTGAGLQIIGGPAACASLAFFGNTELTNAFSTGTLAVGGTLAGGFVPALLAIGASSSLTATTASVAGGTLTADASGATLAVSGTLTLGSGNTTLPPSLLGATGTGSIQLAGLALAGGGTVTADHTASIEIGTLGGAASGAITVDPGITVAGSGSLAPGGTLIDNGTLTAQGGTLQIGASSGTGVLTIATEATLVLTSGDLCPIDFTGGGATLVLGEASPQAAIAGFAPGDAIVAASQVGSVTYAPGTGGLGILTLFNGSQSAGTLLLAGDFSADTFTVVPDGTLSEIEVQAANGGPSGGTSTPDNYVWTATAGTLWNSAANWTDVTAGQSPAAVAPGANDLATIAGGTGAFTSITGPADAASLELTGHVALLGLYSIGTLSVGSDAQTGLLALGQASDVQAASVNVTGGLEAAGAGLSASGTLALTGGVLAATADASITVGAITLAGNASALTTDATSSIAVGGEGGAAGAVSIAAGATLSGAGAVNPLGDIIDQGCITANGGTLALGAVAGGGTLQIGVAATMALEGAAAASLTIDFAGPGTLSVTGPLPAAYIAGFGAGDAILLPIEGITEADYAPSAPNTGVLTLLDQGQVDGALTLLGVGAGQIFTAAAAPGGTLLTTETNPFGGGGSTVRGQQDSTGSGAIGVISSFAFFQALSQPVQLALESATDGLTSYVYTDPSDASGDSINTWAPFAPGYANLAIVSDPEAYAKIVLPAGYGALLAQGGTPVTLTDFGAGDALLLGNAGDDTIVGQGSNDTLVGGSGNSIIFATHSDIVYGGGNDTIITGIGTCAVTTAANHQSLLFLGSVDNIITLSGSDTAVCDPGNGGAADTITATGADTVFAPSVGQLVHNGGAGRDIVVGTGGTIDMYGGTGDGSILWCGNAALAQYYGGAGSAQIAGGSGPLSVQGGAGALTVFGGTGNTTITGAPGPSEYVVGAGAATVTAASGNIVSAASAGNVSLVASGGDVILSAYTSTGRDVLQAGDGPCTMYGGLGADTFLGASGDATMIAGAGPDLFNFTNGLGGGSDSIDNFSPGADTINLAGFSGFTSALVNGSEVLTLTDGTRIALAGVTSMGGVTVTYG